MQMKDYVRQSNTVNEIPNPQMSEVGSDLP